ncbi:MAG: response regulator [Vicinamibacterales bacterium]
MATPRVLVVSDSRITRRVIEMTFADQPLQLAVFAEAGAAIDDWQTRPPAVLIADIALPGPDGYALARTLRDQPAGQRAGVILLASQAEVVDDAAVADVRASAVLRKPLDSHQLVDAVRQTLRNGPPSPAVAVAPPVAVAALAGGASAVAVAEPPPAASAADASPLLGRDSGLHGEPSLGAWTMTGGRVMPDDGLADVFAADGNAAPPAAAAAVTDVTGATDVDRIARRVAELLLTDTDGRQRLDAALAARLAPDQVAAAVASVVGRIAPAIVREMAADAVRDEIARMRAARRV